MQAHWKAIKPLSRDDRRELYQQCGQECFMEKPYYKPGTNQVIYPFPICARCVSGKCSCRIEKLGVRAALDRANSSHHRGVERKASRMLYDMKSGGAILDYFLPCLSPEEAENNFLNNVVIPLRNVQKYLKKSPLHRCYKMLPESKQRAWQQLEIQIDQMVLSLPVAKPLVGGFPRAFSPISERAPAPARTSYPSLSKKPAKPKGKKTPK